MLYSMAGRYLEDALATYRAQGRPVWAQELALTPDQEAELDRFVRRNALPENRDYVYHYYLDNCSTRVRDALDLVLRGELESQFGGVHAGRTWRWHTRRLLREEPLAEAGLQIVLGNPGDETITAWDEMFLPMKLREHVARATVQGADGVRGPLVLGEVQLLESTRPPPPSAPANRLPVALAMGLILAGGAWGVGRAARTSAGARRIMGVWIVVWGGVAGILGAVLVVAWLFTDHDFWRWNENLFQASPLLLAAPLLAGSLLRGRMPGARLATLFTVVAALGVLALLLKLVPGFHQGNWDVIAVLLPTHLALGHHLSRLASRAP